MQAIRLLKKITLILMTPDWCRDEMPVGHHFLTGLEIPFYARWASFFDWPKKKAIRLLFMPGFAWLCLALPGFDTGNTPNYMIMTFL